MMTQVQFERETRYGTVLAIAAVMLEKGILTERDYRKIDTMMRRKYRPVIGGLLPFNSRKTS